jgi:hypothetical protein
MKLGEENTLAVDGGVNMPRRTIPLSKRGIEKGEKIKVVKPPKEQKEKVFYISKDALKRLKAIHGMENVSDDEFLDFWLEKTGAWKKGYTKAYVYGK